MLEPVVSIETAPTIPPSTRAKRLIAELAEAEHAVDEALHAAGLLPLPYISVGAPRSAMTGLHGLRCKEWEARCHHTAFLENRVKRLESAVRQVLADDGLSDDARLVACGALYGRGQPHRRVAGIRAISDTEHVLLERYRSLDDSDRAMLRTLLARLDEAAAARKSGAR